MDHRQQSMRLSQELRHLLHCPICKSKLDFTTQGLNCSQPGCGGRFPIVDGIPVLLNEANSAFTLAEFANQQATTFRTQGKLDKFFSSVIPEITANHRADRNYKRFAELLKSRAPRSKILVVGCGEIGQGMRDLADDPSIELVNTDVSMGSRTAIICDSHDLPFPDGAFDGVIIQAVLEHVADPPRCVAEIYRVMADEGLIYAETPFMQQVHGGPFDFTRYTHLGHRRLFRRFEEIGSGATAGSALALAWAYQYFLLSFVRSQRARSLVKGFARLTACWLRLFDGPLLDRPGTLDAALGYYFLGRKSHATLSDRELVGLYRGACGTLPDPLS